MVTLPFANRLDAGRQLAHALGKFGGLRPLVLAIPRGAVPMGRVIADALGGDLDIVLVKKIGAPQNPEVAIGSVDEQGTIRVSEHARWLGASEQFLRAEAARQLAAMRERRSRLRGGLAPVPIEGRLVIVVDDGLATGATMAAALESLRRQRPARLVCAVPVAAGDALSAIARLADEVVCLATPPHFGAVGHYYLDFSEVDDDRAARALAATKPGAPAQPAGIAHQRVRLDAGPVLLDGDLGMPARPAGLVVFVHGSGSSRRSPRNQAVARALNERGLATLLFDLLAPDEEIEPSARFDIALLARRLRAALDWVRLQPRLSSLPLGLFGASTGAAAALLVAADQPGVAALVSRGGRPDLAGGAALARVRAPTLLVVGGADTQVLELNKAARLAMGANARLAIVPGATHLFEEAGALEQVALLAGDFFLQHLASPVDRPHRDRVRPR